jgi:hypothetical protein
VLEQQQLVLVVARIRVRPGRVVVHREAQVRQRAHREGAVRQALRPRVQTEHALGDRLSRRDVAERQVAQLRVVTGPYVLVGVEADILLRKACRPGVLGVVELADVEALKLQAAEVVRPLPPAPVRVAGRAGQLGLEAGGQVEQPPDALVEFGDQALRDPVVDYLNDADRLGRLLDRVQ